MAFVEFNLSYYLGRGVAIKAYKHSIGEDEFRVLKYLQGDAIVIEKLIVKKGDLRQDDLEQIKIRLDPIIFDNLGFLGYDIIYYTPTYKVGITSLSEDDVVPSNRIYSERHKAWVDWYTPNWHSSGRSRMEQE